MSLHLPNWKLKKFLKDHKALLSIVEEGTVINHFKKTGPDLITIDAGEVIDLEIAVWGKPYYWPSFIHRSCSIQIENGFKPIAAVKPRFGWHTFSNISPVGPKKVARKLESAKVNAVLITKMSLTLKALPDADINDFFRYESQPKLLSSSDHWKPTPSNKSEFLGCLLSVLQPGHCSE